MRFLGRKAELVLFLRAIPELPAEERPEAGRLGNLVRRQLELALESRRLELESRELIEALAKERIDITLPGRQSPLGHLHLVTRTRREIEDIFVGMGYEIADGPEVETEYYNFEALNTPADHPARSLHDTFFVDETVVLRTHTSCAGEDYGGARPTDPHNRPGQSLSTRLGRHPHADVPPGRGIW